MRTTPDGRLLIHRNELKDKVSVPAGFFIRTFNLKPYYDFGPGRGGGVYYLWDDIITIVENQNKVNKFCGRVPCKKRRSKKDAERIQKAIEMFA